MDLVKNNYIYEPDTGILRAKNNLSKRVLAGSAVGCIHKSKHLKYLRTTIKRKSFVVHHIAFYLMAGRWPVQIDHTDGNGLNNRWDNLREATQEENCRNTRLRVNNSSGIMGVSMHRGGKWQVLIMADGKRKYVGIYQDFFEACCARKSAEVEYNYHVNHGQVR